MLLLLECISSALFTALLLLTWQCSAQPTRPPPAAGSTPAMPPAPPSIDSQEYLEAHNQARFEVGVTPLRWSSALARSASLTVRLQRDKQNCSFANLSKSRYGGNQLWAGGIRASPRAAVEAWVAEKKFYDYERNSCEPDHRCGTYTQVVWKQSAEVGCAQAACLKEQSSLTVCVYNPPGNVVGEKPY